MVVRKGWDRILFARFAADPCYIGKRACLGEKFAMLEMRATLIQLVREFSFTLDPTWVDRKTPVSAHSGSQFPVHPTRGALGIVRR
ncbi:hypothetical protein LZ31DRAFT_549794 [Colletotrichum somersetense]|nr:hypothetical protein LZ31DRAFT_549794 [Colletotrichum somersetense]